MTEMSAKPHDLAAKYVWQKINALRTSSNDAKVRAMLARFRHCIGEKPGAEPDVWAYTIGDLPEELQTKSMEPTKAEWAIHIAMTLFAMHQQGSNIQSDCMYREKYTLGKAIRLLADSKGEGGEEAVKRRFNATVTSESIEEFAHHLRSMIQLLKTVSIPLDYEQLTRELVLFQNPDNRDGLRLRWGQDFYRSSSKD